MKKLLSKIASWFEPDEHTKLMRLRTKHVKNGHPFDDWEFIEEHFFLKHPKNDNEVTFVVILYKCKSCGLKFTDGGFSFRKPSERRN